jgi:4-hydroxybenzoyl-CoA reductase subunit beta
LVNVINFKGSVKDAVQILADRQNMKIIAGGTDVLPQMNRGLIKETSFFCIEDMTELKQVKKDEKWLSLGAGLKLAELCEIPELKNYTSVLQAARSVATPQIRNQGTLGGNLLQENRCMYYNQSISWRRSIKKCFKNGGDRCYQYKNSRECVALFQSDLAPTLMSFDARAILESTEGRREVELEKLYLPGGRKDVHPDEILVGIKIPFVSDNYKSAYVRKALRGSFDFPIVSCAVAAIIQEGIIEDINIVFGSAGPFPKVVKEAKDMIAGKAVDRLEEIMPDIMRVSRKHIAPFRDTRCDSFSRRVFADELLQSAMSKLGINIR